MSCTELCIVVRYNQINDMNDMEMGFIELTKVNPRHHAPINRAPVAITQADSNRRTSDALRCRYGQGQTCGHDDSHGRAKFHREATRGRVQSDAVTQIAHDVVSV